jgi:hypothetical protein
MTTLFFFICAISVVFFAVFLIGCSQPRRKSRRAPVVRKAPETQAVDAATGRRFLVHLEKEMVEFIAVHGRTAAMLLIVTASLSLMARPQGPMA